MNETEFEAAGLYSSLSQAHEHGLVVLSMGLNYEVENCDEGFAVLVPSTVAEKVSVELREYEAEQPEWSRQLIEAIGLPVYRVGIVIPYLYVASLLVRYWFQLRFHPVVLHYGASIPKLVVHEWQWWRPVTALFLHAEWFHLAGNAAMGLLFGTLVASSLGPRRGWVLILASGVLGNSATVLMRPLETTGSIGASTAVFGALGILTAFGVTMAFRLRRFFHRNLASKLLPLAAGLTLLAMQGIGDEKTDVLAHLNGFAAGILLGLVFGLRHKSELPESQP